MVFRCGFTSSIKTTTLGIMVNVCSIHTISSNNMISITPLTHAEQDYQKYYVKSPTGEFSVERNNYIINKTIEDYEKMRKDKAKAYEQKIRERVDAAMSYAKHLESNGATPAEKYFGKKTLAHLQGQKIANSLKLANGRRMIMDD